MSLNTFELLLSLRSLYLLILYRATELSRRMHSWILVDWKDYSSRIFHRTIYTYRALPHRIRHLIESIIALPFARRGSRFRRLRPLEIHWKRYSAINYHIWLQDFTLRNQEGRLNLGILWIGTFLLAMTHWLDSSIASQYLLEIC